MITLIHGDDIVASRNYYREQRQKVQNGIELQGEKITMNDLVPLFEGNALFFEHKHFFIENFFSKRKASKETTEIASYLASQEATIYFYEIKEVSKKNLSLLPKSTQKLFKLPQTLFAFLDGIKPQNTQSITLFHEALKQTEAELLFFMLVRQVRLLLGVSGSHSGNNIDEVARLAPWQKGKLQKQACQFAVKQLKDMHAMLYDIEQKVKTSRGPLSLTQQIDIFLLEI